MLKMAALFYGLVFAKKLKQYRDVFRKPAWNNL